MVDSNFPNPFLYFEPENCQHEGPEAHEEKTYSPFMRFMGFRVYFLFSFGFVNFPLLTAQTPISATVFGMVFI